MDTRLAILSAAAFAGVVLGGAAAAEPGLAGRLNPSVVWADLKGSGEQDDTRLVEQNADPVAQDNQFTDGRFATTGTGNTTTRSGDDHDGGRRTGDTKTRAGGRGPSSHEDREDDD